MRHSPSRRDKIGLHLPQRRLGRGDDPILFRQHGKDEGQELAGHLVESDQHIVPSLGRYLGIVVGVGAVLADDLQALQRHLGPYHGSVSTPAPLGIPVGRPRLAPQPPAGEGDEDLGREGRPALGEVPHDDVGQQRRQLHGQHPTFGVVESGGRRGQLAAGGEDRRPKRHPIAVAELGVAGLEKVLQDQQSVQRRGGGNVERVGTSRQREGVRRGLQQLEGDGNSAVICLELLQGVEGILPLLRKERPDSNARRNGNG